MYINSPGGVVTAGLAVYDTMQAGGGRGLGRAAAGVGRRGRAPPPRRPLARPPVHPPRRAACKPSTRLTPVPQYIRSPVSTLCVGQAASMASLLLAAGEPGHRRALPHARILLHQPSGGYQGQATDIRIHTAEILRLRAAINDIYAAHTGQTADKIGEWREGLGGWGGVGGAGRWPRAAVNRAPPSPPPPPPSPASPTSHSVAETLERDTFQSAAEARDFGLLDEVIAKRPVGGEL